MQVSDAKRLKRLDDGSRKQKKLLVEAVAANVALENLLLDVLRPTGPPCDAALFDL